MTVYLVNIFITFLFSAGLYRSQDLNLPESPRREKKKRNCLLCILLSWTLVAAFRGRTGTDTWAYMNSYSLLYKMHSISFAWRHGRDKLFFIIMYFVAQLSKGNWIYGCAAIGLMAYVPILILFSRKSHDIQLSLLLYIFILSYYFSFNGSRQGISVSISIVAYYFGLREKKIIKYIILMIISMLFHPGAMILIPFHLASLGNYRSPTYRIILFVFFAGAFIIFRFWNGVLEVFDLLGQEKIARDYANLTAGRGSGFLRIVVATIPVMLGLMYHKKIIANYRDADSDLFLVICYAIVYVYSYFNASFAQLAEYFVVPNCIYYPKVFNSMSPKNGKSMRALALMVYFVYMVLMLRKGEMEVYPYRWSL